MRPNIWAFAVATFAATATLVVLTRELTVVWPLIYPGRAAVLALQDASGFRGHALLPWFALAAVVNALACGSFAWLVCRLIRRQSTRGTG
jgi:hypothetical protein